MESTPQEIARCLRRDLDTPEAGIWYCNHAIVRDGELWPKYQAAAAILQTRLNENTQKPL
jgi:hypothetical protein